MPSLLSQLLAPPTCLGCGIPSTAWCGACAAIRPNPSVVDLGLPVLTLFPFEGAVRRVIVEWKEEHRRDAGSVVRGWLECALPPVLEHLPTAVVAPVPSSPGTDRLRGARPLLEALKDVLPERILSRALVAAGPRLDQAGLDRRARHMNMQGALRWDGPVPDTVVVVDDIVTTGATLRESARAVRRAGASQVLAVAIAHRDRADPVARWGRGLCCCQEDEGGSPWTPMKPPSSPM